MRGLTSTMGFAAFAWRTLRARPARTALTATGIALGVAVLFAGLMTDAASTRSVDQAVRDELGRADLRISAFDNRALSTAAVSAVRDARGVQIAAPVLQRRTYLGAASVGAGAVGTGSASSALPPAVTVFGVDPTLEPAVHDLALSTGSPLARPDEASALVSTDLAERAGVAVGQEISIDGSPDASPDDLRFRVVGILAPGTSLSAQPGPIVVVPLVRAERAFSPLGPTRVDLRVAEGATPDGVAADIARRLTTEPYVVTTPAEVRASLGASASPLESSALAVAAIALVAAAFLIVGTLSATVAERARDVGLLRAAGATRRQVAAVVLVAAAMLGAIGASIGVALGAGVAAVLASPAFGPDPAAGLVPSSDLALVAWAAGVAMTVAAAFGAAGRASRVTPTVALGYAPPAGGVVGREGGSVVAVGTAIAVVGLLVVPTGLPAGSLVAAIAVVVGLTALAVVTERAMPVLAWLAGAVFRFRLAAEERLARAAVTRDRGRAGRAIASFAVGLAAMVALATVASTTRAAAASWVDDVLPADLVATSVTSRPLDDGTQSELAAVAGVDRVTPMASFDVAFRGVRLDAAAVVGADLLDDGRITLVRGDRSAALAALDDGGSVIVPATTANRLGLGVGDDMTFALGKGRTEDLRVVGIAERSLPGHAGEALLVGWNDATTGFGVAGADSYAIRLRADADDAVTTAVAANAARLGLQVETFEQVEGAIAASLERTFGVLDALALAAIAIAALGIATALSASVLERVRELGVLRAAGMTRRQLWRMVVVEAGIVGLASALVGVPSGVAVGLGATVAWTGGSPLVLQLDAVPWSSAALAGALGIAAAMLAATYPATLAGRLPIPRAVRA